MLRVNFLGKLLIYQTSLLLGAAARRLEVIERRPVGTDFLLRARVL